MRIAKLTIVAFALLVSWAASAVTFTVNSVADTPAGDNLPNGVCETAPGNGVCTLRAALQKANALPGVGAVINVPAGTYIRGSVYPDVVAPVTIQGAGLASTIIDAAGLDRGLTIQLGMVATINGVTIRNAAATKTSLGVGVTNLGTTTIADSQIVDGKDSGVLNVGTLVIRNSSILRNAAASVGGGVFNQKGALTVVNSLVANNAAGAGGGIYVVQGNITLVNSTISNNVATSHGGGVGMAPATGESTVEVFNSTIAGNLVTAGNPTVGGGLENLGGTVRLQNSLLANNFIGTNGSDCAGAIVSLDYNWLQTAAGCTLSGATTHNQIGGDPMLDSLRLNGGPTLTRALLAGSPAIDAIPAARCTDALGAPLTTDQRGSPRPSGAFCNIGAFEGALPSSIFNVNLIRNGDAEQSVGDATGARVGVPNWTTRGSFTVVRYGAAGGFPVVGTDVVQAAHGYNFFAGGPAAFDSTATQTIDLASATAEIDAGNVFFFLSGDFGGYATDSDNASLDIRFLDAAQNTIGNAYSAGPIMDTDRGNKTGLFGALAPGLVPAGARSAVVTLTMTYVNGEYNDGYADNLKLMLVDARNAPDLDQHGLTGSWFESATAGQGIEVEVFPDLAGAGKAFAQVSWYTFDQLLGEAERQRWYTLGGPLSSKGLAIYENTGGNFNAPPETTANMVGFALLSFDTCDSAILIYQFDDGSGRKGFVPLTRLLPSVTCSTTAARPTNADFALSGNWFDPATSGQGLTIEVNPVAGAVFAGWYTYTPAGAASGQRWFTIQGAFTAGARSLPVKLYETTGGLFDAPTFPAPNTVAVGSGTLSFVSCSSAKLDYNFTGGSSAGKAGSISLVRVGSVPPGCA